MNGTNTEQLLVCTTPKELWCSWGICRISHRAHSITLCRVCIQVMASYLTRCSLFMCIWLLCWKRGTWSVLFKSYIAFEVHDEKVFHRKKKIIITGPCRKHGPLTSEGNCLLIIPCRWRRAHGELSRGCHVLIVQHHPTNSMRTSPKAHQRIFFPRTPQVAQSLAARLLGLVIKSIFTASVPARLCSKPRCIAAQWAAGWRKGQERLSSSLLLLCFMIFLFSSTTAPVHREQNKPQHLNSLLRC